MPAQFKNLVSITCLVCLAFLYSCHGGEDKFSGKVNKKQTVSILHHPSIKDTLSLDSFRLISFKPDYPVIEPGKDELFDTIVTDSVYQAPADSPEVRRYSRIFKNHGKASIRIELKNYPIKDDILQHISLYRPDQKKAYKFLLKGFNHMYEYTAYSGDSLLFHTKLDKKAFSKYLPFFLTELDFTYNHVEVVACNPDCKRIVFKHRTGIPYSCIGLECYYIMNFAGDILSANYNFSLLRPANCALDVSKDNNLFLAAHECFNFRENTKFNFDPGFNVTATRILNDTCFLVVYDLRNGKGLHEHDNAFIFSSTGRKLYSFKFDGWNAGMNGFYANIHDDTIHKKIWMFDNERELFYQFSSSKVNPEPLSISKVMEIKDTSQSGQKGWQILNVSGFKHDKYSYIFIIFDRKGKILGFYKREESQ